MGATKPRNTPLIPASKRTRRLCTYLADAPEFDKSVRLKEEANGALGAAKMTFEDADKHDTLETHQYQRQQQLRKSHKLKDT
ncbi:hypothetical protein IFM46972_11266 [Aspergillus udagawae]|uniref:Uncharacterized protein n=1 Tax=Aspergillus udagawae TaxID=91492 RepID=A0A8H3SGC8_9EURO|nr:hypothetical protein IFM46972_11266 [Aspergillus udagawae]